MRSNHQKPEECFREPRLYDAILDEFLSWMEESHDEWHRRMDKLHKELEQAHQAARDFDRSKMK
jgi:hypothetical protein